MATVFSGDEQMDRLSAVVESLTVAVERLTIAAERDAVANMWLTVDEAAARCKATPKYIYAQIRDGRLERKGDRKKILISRLQLDDQIARGWPRLEVVTPEEAADRVLRTRQVSDYLARPRRPRSSPAKNTRKRSVLGDDGLFHLVEVPAPDGRQ